MRWNPDVTVAAVVMRDGRFLVVEERIAGRLVLNQPAGHLEEHETLLEAVIRETREETAWRFEPRALVGIYLWRNPVDGRGFLRFAFLVRSTITAHSSRWTRASCGHSGCRRPSYRRSRHDCVRRWSCAASTISCSASASRWIRWPAWISKRR